MDLLTFFNAYDFGALISLAIFAFAAGFVDAVIAGVGLFNCPLCSPTFPLLLCLLYLVLLKLHPLPVPEWLLHKTTNVFNSVIHYSC